MAETLQLLGGPVIAFAGVALGSWVSWRGQERIRRREERHRSREAARQACGAYLAAARQFDQYVKQSNTEITAVPHTISPILLLDERGESHWRALEAASAALLFVDLSPRAIHAAGQLRTALSRLAAGRASRPAGTIPDDAVLAVLAAERAFVDASRLDLEMDAVAGIIRAVFPGDPPA